MRKNLGAFALLVSVSAAAVAAPDTSSPPPPVATFPTFAGVDLKTGLLTLKAVTVSSGALGFQRTLQPGYSSAAGGSTPLGNIQRPECTSNNVQFCSNTLYIRMGDSSQTYSRLASTHHGLILRENVRPGITEVVDRDGNVWTFDTALKSPYITTQISQLSAIKFASGEIWRYYYDSNKNILNVTSTRGSILIGFSSIVNTAFVYCNPTVITNSCSPSNYKWHSISVSRSGTTSSYVGPLGETYTVTDGPLSGNKQTITATKPTGSWFNADVSLIQNQYSVFNVVTRIARGFGDWNFAYTLSTVKTNLISRTDVTDPAGKVTSFYADDYGLYRIVDPNLRTTSYSYATEGGLYGGWKDLYLTGVTYPEGNSVAYAYDSRDNLKSISLYDKGRAAAGTWTFSYSDDCDTHPAYCNKPIAITDPGNRVTRFKYNDKGQKVAELFAADAQGKQRLVTYSYVDAYAYVMNSSGVLVKAEAPISVVSRVATCESASTNNIDACAAGTERNSQTYRYGADGTANTLLPRAITYTGSGATAVTTCFGYDVYAQQIWETKPNGSASCPA